LDLSFKFASIKVGAGSKQKLSALRKRQKQNSRPSSKGIIAACGLGGGVDVRFPSSTENPWIHFSLSKYRDLTALLSWGASKTTNKLLLTAEDNLTLPTSFSGKVGVHQLNRSQIMYYAKLFIALDDFFSINPKKVLCKMCVILPAVLQGSALDPSQPLHA
jgi:hypothetical protein